MRLYPSILVVSLALLESGSQASKVRGTAAVNPTTEAVSVADNQHGLSLLSTTNGEDRMFKNLVNAFKMLKKNRPNVDNKTPDELVKKHLEELIPSLGESSSSARPPINVQGATSSTVRQSLQTLSDEQKIQLGVKFIRGKLLENLEKDVGMSMREGGEDAVDVIFSAMCKHLGEDVTTKVVMDVEKARITSFESREKLAKAQFRYWQENRKSYADVSGSLRKLEKKDVTDEEKIENFGLYAWMLDSFIKFRNYGEPNDKRLFAYLTQGDGIIEFVDFISKGKQIPHRLRTNADELEIRYFEYLKREQTTLASLFASLKVKDDEIHMFSGPKFDFMIRYASYSKSKEYVDQLGLNMIFIYKKSLGEAHLGYWLARAVAKGDEELKNNAKYMANLLFKVIGSEENLKPIIGEIKHMTYGEDAAEFLNGYRLEYKQQVIDKILEGLNNPFVSTGHRGQK